MRNCGMRAKGSKVKALATTAAVAAGATITVAAVSTLGLSATPRAVSAKISAVRTAPKVTARPKEKETTGNEPRTARAAAPEISGEKTTRPWGRPPEIGRAH